MFGCTNAIQSIIDLAATRKIQICTKGPATACDSKNIITLDKVTMVSHNTNGDALNPPHQVYTQNGVVFSAVINGNTVYFGAATDWATEWNNIKDLNDAQKDHALTQFFQNQFDTFGFFTQVPYSVPDGNGGTINMFKYEFVNNPGNYFSVSGESSKDLEAMGAKLERINIQSLSERLVSNYGLSEERADSVARHLKAYEKISSKRSLTSKEKDFFSNELLGVNYRDAQNAFTGGNNEELNDLVERAAEKNGTSPEQISDILSEILL